MKKITVEWKKENIICLMNINVSLIKQNGKVLRL